MSQNDKHPKSGILSVTISSISLLMLLIAIPMGIFGHGQRGFSAFVGFLLLSIFFAIVGIISGCIGVRSAKKLLPVMGILIGSIFFVIFAVIILATAMK